MEGGDTGEGSWCYEPGKTESDELVERKNRKAENMEGGK